MSRVESLTTDQIRTEISEVVTELTEEIAAIPAPRNGQYVPPVGGTFTSSFLLTNTTSTLRARDTAPMPFLLDQTIYIDRVSFNLTVLAAAAGQTGTIVFQELAPGADSWTTLQTLATGIPLAAPATTGVKDIDLGTPLTLEAGKIYGFVLDEEQTYDATLRVTQATMTGPGIGNPAVSFNSGWNVPVGANVSLVTAVPVIRLRRSA